MRKTTFHDRPWEPPFSYTANLLKASPKGEGFQPSPRWDTNKLSGGRGETSIVSEIFLGKSSAKSCDHAIKKLSYRVAASH